MNRVVITGMGVVSPLGNTLGDFWAGLRAGRCGIGPIELFDASELEVGIAAEVRGFDPAAHFERARSLMMDRVSQFAVVAAREAAAQSGLDFRGDIGLKTAGIVGTGIGGQQTVEAGYRRLFLEGSDRVNPFTIPKLMANAPASQISLDLGVRGPVFAVASACASSNHAMGISFQMVRAGAVTAALTGGAEACVSYGGMRSWESLRVLAQETCRPFSRDRDGLVLGEGAGVFVFEALEDARSRGAEILAEVVGSGMSSDADSLVHPSAEGAARALKGALDDARVAPEAIDYVNAHGTGTSINDRVETEVLYQVFGDRAKDLPVSSTKSMHGHPLGAAGALELAATVMALRHAVLPPTVNYTEADPECALYCVPNVAVDRAITTAVSNSFAFGGLNAVLAVRRWRES